VKYDLTSGILNVFFDTSSDDLSYSLVDLSKPLVFDDDSFDSLETFQEVEALQPLLMVIPRSCNPDKFSKHDQIKIPSHDNAHDSIEHIENVSIFQFQVSPLSYISYHDPITN